MKLDLGCGTTPAEGYVGVDLPEDETIDSVSLSPLQPKIDERGVIRFDLASGIPWPFADDSVDGLYSAHVIEHLPAEFIETFAWERGEYGQSVLRRTGMQDALFWFLDEAWRVTKPGGKFLLRWPSLEDARTGAIQLAAFQDPTHRRFIPSSQIHYWSATGRKTLGVEQYRIRCDWTVAALEVEGQTVPHLCQRELGTVLETEVCLEKKVS